MMTKTAICHVLIPARLGDIETGWLSLKLIAAEFFNLVVLKGEAKKGRHGLLYSTSRVPGFLISPSPPTTTLKLGPRLLPFPSALDYVPVVTTTYSRENAVESVAGYMYRYSLGARNNTGTRMPLQKILVSF
jgi:hypothetical protein